MLASHAILCFGHATPQRHIRLAVSRTIMGAQQAHGEVDDLDCTHLRLRAYMRVRLSVCVPLAPLFACACRGLFCLRVSRNVPEAMELRAGEMDAELHAVEAHPRFREAMHEYMAFQNAMIPSCNNGSVSPPDHSCVTR